MTGLSTIIIGFGQIADGLGRDERMSENFEYATHAQVLADHPAFDWLGVVDPSVEALGAARDSWQIPHVGADIDTVAKAVQPEVAIITAPADTRAEIVQQLPNLKAVLVEKPLGGSDAEATSFVDFCRDRNIAVQVNYWRRADELYRKLAAGELLRRIGRPQAAFATYGSGLHNNGSHMIDFIRMLLGEVAMVQALGDARHIDNPPLPGDQHAAFALTMTSGTVVTVHPLDFNRYREVGLDIWGETGRLALLQESLGVYHYPLADNRGLDDAMEIASDRPEVLEPTAGRALYDMYDNLASVLAGNGELWSSGDSALSSERILDAVLDSADRSGERLHFA